MKEKTIPANTLKEGDTLKIEASFDPTKDVYFIVKIGITKKTKTK